MKKQKQSLLIQVWGNYEFYLYIPTEITRNSKPFIFYYYKDIGNDKSVRIRRFLSQNKGDKKLIQNEAKEVINELQILLSGNYNPIRKTYNELKITPLSNIMDCIRHWLEYNERALINGTIGDKRLKNLKIGMAHFIDFLSKRDLKQVKPSMLTNVHLKEYLDTKAHERNWGKVSYNTYKIDLNTFYNYLIDLTIVKFNPVKRIPKKSTRYDSSRFQVYEIHELRNVAELLSKDPSYLGLHTASKLLFKYNIRPLEITRIQVRDIDWHKGVLTLSPNKTKNGNEAKFLLEDSVIQLLKRLIKDAPEDHYIFCARNKTSQIQTFADYFGQRWRAFRIKYNIPTHLKFYALKHSSNYYDIESGSSYEEIRQRNRHSNLQVTTLYIKERLFKNIIKPSGSLQFQ